MQLSGILGLKRGFNLEGMMPNQISTPLPRETEQKSRLEDVRADWERPALRRLAAIEAQAGGEEQHHHLPHSRNR
jgi:hypothetical protein